MRAEAKKIRKIFKAYPGAWVREYADGVIWAGFKWRPGFPIVPISELRSALEGAGYRTSLDGQPGTSGENIITINRN